MGVQGDEASRRRSLGWLATALLAAMAVVVCVDAWTAEVTAQAAQALSVNALRSGELSEEMRWQLVRLTPGPGVPAGLEPSSAQALLRLGRDVAAYEKLVTSDEERREWKQLSRFSRELADAWSRGDDEWATHAAAGASAAAERLIVLNHADADAIGNELVSLGRSQIAIDTFAGAIALFAFAQVTRARLRSLERERSAIARHLGAVEQKNRELEAFAGRVAHDLRAPLTPVHALAGLLVRGGQGEGDVRRLAGKIVASTSRMSSLIDAMLAFSQSGRPPAGECLAGPVVAEVLEELRPESGGAEIRVEVPEARMGCAPEVFAQILRNLVGNALKYRSTERPARVQVTGTLGLQTLTLAVEDNGIGMAPRAARRAFEPFFRASADRPGHGLGLAIVDRYVRALGGSIELTSKLGVGTHVEVRLPAAPAKAEVESVAPTVSTLQLGGAPAGGLRSMG
jgi:signal transduction histidine kinase